VARVIPTPINRHYTMDHFYFKKIITCSKILTLKVVRSKILTESVLKENEANILSKNDTSLPGFSQKRQEKINSSFQNPSKKGVK
jgi:hypothetical protein